ncbi:MAG: 50S ribosomal protein L19 [Parcubacteria group bacterium GW2011_GWC1_41_7]|nr:MAG: 50S ribosomal protein L19 [Parcubacteria group bacterium GW2011_GWC1_41_7]
MSAVKTDTKEQIGMPDVKPGMVVRVVQAFVDDKGKEINKAFRGIVIARKHGNEIGATFTVRGEASGQIIEKIFPIHSPMVKKIEVIGESKTRRSKLYFIRELSPNKIRKKLKTKYTAKK